MTYTAAPNVPLPTGGVFGDIWEGDYPRRVIFGADRGSSVLHRRALGHRPTACG